MTAQKQLDPATQLLSRIEQIRESAAYAISSGSFYTQLILVCVAVVGAYLAARLFKSYYRRHRARYDVAEEQDLVTMAAELCLRLLCPILALMLLAVMQTVSEAVIGSGGFVRVATLMCLAWLANALLGTTIKNRALAHLSGAVILFLMLLGIAGLLESITQYLDSLAFEIGKLRLSVLSLFKGTLLLVALLWLSRTLSSMLDRALSRSTSLNYSSRELIRKFSAIVLYFLAIVISLNVVGVDLTALAVFGGALGVGIGLGLQKITANFISGIILLMEKSIKPGDLIEIGSDKGWVRNLSIRYTLIDTPDGRELLIPNEEIMSQRVMNWTLSNTRGRVDINASIPYSADVERAMALMLEAAHHNSNCLKDPAPLCFLREFGDSAMHLLLQFWIGNVHEGTLRVKSEIMQDIIRLFRENNIQMPFPQREIILRHAPD